MKLSKLPRRAAFALATGCLLGAWLAPAPAMAQGDAWPSRPITLVVGYPPGGSTDLTGRVVAEQLARKLGVPVVVENVGGAGGAIGAQKVVNAAPDGYTLMLGANNEVAIARLISPAVRYTEKDFTPIGLVASQPMVLVASAASGVKNVDDFLQRVKAQPGRYSFGSSGVGTGLHLAGELVKQQGGLFMTHIPYRGVAPLTNDLLGGSIEYGVFVLSSGLPHIRSGKVVALGVTEKKRSPAAPEIPSLSEHAAFRNLDINIWFALLAPPRLPAPIAARLRTALNESLQAPELRKKLEDSGSTIATPVADMEGFLASETAKYKKIVDYAGIRE
ncbi:MAG: tripartite tricarboxylate transporter substrate binding protein [Burkholderiales bacterium]|nr:tripartite tricarboxylate transporter substrate binding protein [Burkholderiales bacterium]